MLRKQVLNVVPRRTFVSTVLLTRNWENETMNVLKKEARKRGLLQYVQFPIPAEMYRNVRL